MKTKALLTFSVDSLCVGDTINIGRQYVLRVVLKARKPKKWYQYFGPDTYFVHMEVESIK